jgi:hypothetical protein
MSDYSPKHRKRRVAVPVIVAGGLSSLLLAFSFTPTFSALTAAITNSGNTAGTGTLVMEETGPNSTGVSTTCTTGVDGTATCSTINKYGGTNPSTDGYLKMKPGDTQTSTITIKNTGTLDAASLTVKGGTCTDTTQGTVSGTATNLCDMYTITIMKGATVIVPATTTATAFASAAAANLGTVAAGGSVTVTVTATLSASATAANQGHVITQPIVWTFQA